MSECPRCLQNYYSPQRLRSHLNRKNKCKVINPNYVEMKKEDFIAEHKDLVKVLDLDTKTAKGPGVKKELKEQSEELKKYTSSYKIKTGINLQLDPKTGNSTVILGSSKAGKSTLLMYLYNKYYKDYISVLFSDNPQIDLYKDKKLIKSAFFIPQIIKDFHRINRNTKNKYEFCCLLDDIVNEKEDEMLKRLVLSFRNSNISSIVSIQSPTLLNKSNRSSINNIIFFRFNTDEMIEQVIKFFLTSFLTGKMEDKIKQYKDMTKDHQFIYLNPRENKISIHKIYI